MLAGAALLLENGLTMFGQLDGLAPAPAASVPGDSRAEGVEDAEPAIVCGDGERLEDVARGDGVGVDVEADEGGLVHARGCDQVGLGQGRRKCEQPVLLLLEAIAHGAVGDGGMGPIEGDASHEIGEFAVALLDARDFATGEEAVTAETDRPLDATFLVGLADRAGTRLDVHLAGEVEQQRVKADSLADPTEYDGLGIVEEPLPAVATEVDGCAKHRAKQGVDGEVEDEFAPERARPGKDHDEEPERAASTTDIDIPHVRPVHLGLLADERVGAEVRLSRWPGPHTGDEVAQGADAAFEAPGDEHVVQARRAQTGVLGQGLLHEGPEGIDDARSWRAWCARLEQAQHALDRLWVHAQL